MLMMRMVDHRWRWGRNRLFSQLFMICFWRSGRLIQALSLLSCSRDRNSISFIEMHTFWWWPCDCDSTPRSRVHRQHLLVINWAIIFSPLEFAEKIQSSSVNVDNNKRRRSRKSSTEEPRGSAISKSTGRKRNVQKSSPTSPKSGRNNRRSSSAEVKAELEVNGYVVDQRKNQNTNFYTQQSSSSPESKANHLIMSSGRNNQQPPAAHSSIPGLSGLMAHLHGNPTSNSPNTHRSSSSSSRGGPLMHPDLMRAAAAAAASSSSSGTRGSSSKSSHQQTPQQPQGILKKARVRDYTGTRSAATNSNSNMSSSSSSGPSSSNNPYSNQSTSGSVNNSRGALNPAFNASDILAQISLYSALQHQQQAAAAHAYLAGFGQQSGSGPASAASVAQHQQNLLSAAGLSSGRGSKSNSKMSSFDPSILNLARNNSAKDGPKASPAAHGRISVSPSPAAAAAGSSFDDSAPLDLCVKKSSGPSASSSRNFQTPSSAKSRLLTDGSPDHFNLLNQLNLINNATRRESGEDERMSSGSDASSQPRRRGRKPKSLMASGSNSGQTQQQAATSALMASMMAHNASSNPSSVAAQQLLSAVASGQLSSSTNQSSSATQGVPRKRGRPPLLSPPPNIAHMRKSTALSSAASGSSAGSLLNPNQSNPNLELLNQLGLAGLFAQAAVAGGQNTGNNWPSFSSTGQLMFPNSNLNHSTNAKQSNGSSSLFSGQNRPSSRGTNSASANRNSYPSELLLSSSAAAAADQQHQQDMMMSLMLLDSDFMNDSSLLDSEPEDPSKRDLRPNLNQEDIRIPLRYGWKRHTIIKKISAFGIKGEILYFSPDNKRVKSHNDVAKVSLLDFIPWFTNPVALFLNSI